MTTPTEQSVIESDPAAAFATALSLWESCKARAEADSTMNLSETYHGMDQFMRVVVEIGNRFETWACQHVDFNSLNDVWTYLLEDRFGDSCLKILQPVDLAGFNDDDCLRVALDLKLPVVADGQLPVPVDEQAPLPTNDGGFAALRIQTVRDLIEENESEAFVLGDEPFDENFESPYFALYGVGTDGMVEHIASRRTYADAIKLARNLIPVIELPDKPKPTFTGSPAPGSGT